LKRVFHITHPFSGQISCGAAFNGSMQGTNKGSDLEIEIYIKKCPNGCMTMYCIDKCALAIEAAIQSKFGSTSFPLTIETTNGTVSILIQFCAFGVIVSGKRQVELVSLNRDGFNVKYENRDQMK
jgi:hypothetical protein